MKSYTDIQQSMKLAKILPVESADMYFEPSAGFCTEPSEIKVGDIKYAHPRSVPCWSLAALLNYLREIDFFPTIDADEHSVTMSIYFYNEEEGNLLNPVHNIKVESDDFIDACYGWILKLKEKNLL